MTNVYTTFVKDNYATVKEKNPDTNSKDILRLIAADWNAKKPKKEVKPKKVKPEVKPVPKKEIKKPTSKKPKTVPIELNGDNIEDGIANIEDGIQRNPPPTELAQKVFKTKPKIGTKKRKSTETEEATTA